ncbi:MAG TPA: hypothetical protein VG099_28955, partial [Gemmataceae bacterium]|nr:hypothetical protein [Gemmataceae bacterium]
ETEEHARLNKKLDDALAKADVPITSSCMCRATVYAPINSGRDCCSGSCGCCECRERITDMPSEVSQATSLDWPAFSTFARQVNRVRVEGYVWLYDDAA